MTKEHLKKICDSLDTYIISPNQVEPMSYLYGEEKNEEKTPKAKAMALNTGEDLVTLKKVVKNFSEKLRSFLEGNLEFKDLEENGDVRGIFYKAMGDEDLEKTNSLSQIFEDSIEFTDFIKGKFQNNFIVIEINLNSEGTKKIVLFKGLSSTYYAKKSKWAFSAYNSRQKISFLDNKENIILDDYFDFIAFIDNEASFFFILGRKRFEDLYGYHEKYNEAYETLSIKMDFIDWTQADATLQIKRDCYGLANFVRLDECIEEIKSKLISIDDNPIKHTLNQKKIIYTVEGGNVQIIPDSASSLRSLLKILKDGVAKTCLLNRDVLGSDFEEIE